LRNSLLAGSVHPFCIPPVFARPFSNLAIINQFDFSAKIVLIFALKLKLLKYDRSIDRRWIERSEQYRRRHRSEEREGEGAQDDAATVA
jgi:hypothetical protein